MFPHPREWVVTSMLKPNPSAALASTLLLLAYAPSGNANTALQTPVRRAVSIRSAKVINLSPALEGEMLELPVGIEAAELIPADDEGEEEGPETERLKKLKKLKFDRRPSAVLNAWANDPSEDEAEEEPKTPAEQPAPVDTEGMSEEEAAEAIADAEKARAKKAKKEAEKRAEKEAALALERELSLFQRQVTLSDWDGVRTYLAELPKAEGKAAYVQLIASLVEGPERVSGTLAKFAEKNYFDDEHLVGLVGCAPHGFAKAQVKGLGFLLKQTVREGCLIETCLDSLRIALGEETFPLQRNELAHVLLEGAFQVEAGEFLPSLSEAQAADDRPVLNLIARHHLARHQRESAEEDLDLAWQATMSVLAEGEVEDAPKEEALKRAVQLAPKVHATKGQSWLAESFTSRPERGMEILSLIGASSSRALMSQARQLELRKTSLELQTTATEALLAADPLLAKEWSDTLTLLANNWLQEADCTQNYDKSTSRGQSMQMDPFGNIFYAENTSQLNNRNAPIPIPTNDMLAMRPSEPWLELIADGLRPRMEIATASLLLKVKAEEEAFPYIERLAADHPTAAEEFVGEFLRVWITNHNPNENNNRTNDYMFIYGFSQQAAGIPLTRSKRSETSSSWPTG